MEGDGVSLEGDRITMVAPREDARPRQAKMPDEDNGESETALYRHFAVTGKLLYVGIATNPLDRLSQHKQGAEWFRPLLV